MTVVFRFSDDWYCLPRYFLRTPGPLFCLSLLRRQRTLFGHLYVAWPAQCSHPSTNLSRNSREAWVISLLEFRHIHMITANSYWSVAGEDSGFQRNDLNTHILAEDDAATYAAQLTKPTPIKGNSS